MKVLLVIIYLVVPLCLTAGECDLTNPIKTFSPHYAQHFSIDYFKDFKILHVDHDFYFLSNQKKIDCEAQFSTINTPVKKVVMMSTTYLPTLILLGLEKTLIGFQGKHYIVSPSFDLSGIQDVSFKFNAEDLLKIKADMIMGYSSNLSSPKEKMVFNKLKIPVVINKDFEEKNPLARAEWIVFIASFYNRDQEAMDLFHTIEKDYLDLKEKNSQIRNKPQVLVGNIQNGKWSTCGLESDLAQMISDAGGELILKKKSSSTQSISLEELSLIKATADVWLPQNTWTSRKDLDKAIKSDPRYSMIKSKKVFNNNQIRNYQGSNDYWEMGMQRPDLMLKDLTALFHQEQYSTYKLKWYRPL